MKRLCADDSDHSIVKVGHRQAPLEKTPVNASWSGFFMGTYPVFLDHKADMSNTKKDVNTKGKPFLSRQKFTDLLAAGKWQEVLLQVQTMRKLPRKLTLPRHELYSLEALALYNSGQLAKAAAAFERAYLLNLEDRKNLYNSAVCNFQLGRFEHALALFSALKLHSNNDPNLAWVHCYRRVCELHLGLLAQQDQPSIPQLLHSGNQGMRFMLLSNIFSYSVLKADREVLQALTEEEAQTDDEAVILAASMAYLSGDDETTIAILEGLTATTVETIWWSLRIKLIEGLCDISRTACCKKDAIEKGVALPYLQSDYAHHLSELCDWINDDNRRNEFAKNAALSPQSYNPFHALAMTKDPSLQRRIAISWCSTHYGHIERSKLESVRSANPRVGFFSADFNNHAVGLLTRTLFKAIEVAGADVHLYSFSPRSDEVTDSFRNSIKQFTDLSRWSNKQILEVVRSDKLDIAFDMMGHTGERRTELFAHGLAPLHVNYLGYPGTLGSEFHDYIIADPFTIPGSMEGFYTEKVIRLPHCYQPNNSMREKPLDFDLTTRTNSEFIFASFNATFKLSSEYARIWAKILTACPDSKLWIYTNHQTTRQNILDFFFAKGIKKERLFFCGSVSVLDHLYRHNSIDLLLDSTPYGAHTTASDALWMGVPVLTNPGNTFASRVAASICKAHGENQFIAEGINSYYELAVNAYFSGKVSLAARKERANRLSPLFATDAYARDFVNLLKVILGNA